MPSLQTIFFSFWAVVSGLCGLLMVWVVLASLQVRAWRYALQSALNVIAMVFTTYCLASIALGEASKTMTPYLLCGMALLYAPAKFPADKLPPPGQRRGLLLASPRQLFPRFFANRKP